MRIRNLVIACTLSMASLSTAWADINSGLVGYWPFDEGAGTSTADASGQGHTNTLVNAPVWTPGKVGKTALKLNGTNQYMTVSNFSVGSINFTIAGWIKSTLGKANYVITQEKGLGESRWYLQLPTSNGKIAFYTDATNWQISSGSVTSNEWFHFAIIGTSTSTQIFINGINEGTFKSMGDISSNNTTLSIGHSFNYGSYFNGAIDDLRIYNRAISTDEIQELYTLGANNNPQYDTQPPSIPTDLTGTAINSSEIDLSWSNGTDNVGVVGYRIFRNGSLIADLSANTYSDIKVDPDTSYAYTVVAYDAENNTSNASVALAIKTPILRPSLHVLTSGSGTVSGGGIECGSNCVAFSDIGSSIVLSAEPSAGSRFAGWSGGSCVGTGNCTVTFLDNSPVTVSAVFSTIGPQEKLLPDDRLPLPGTWESAGVEGGIPDRQTICADVTKAPYNADNTGAVSAVAAIQAAINNCPNGQVVYVPAGTYLIDGRLRIQYKSITLRGAGPSTVFQVTGSSAILIGGLGPWPPPKASDTYRMPVISGSTRGSNTVTVASTSTIPVGKMIMVDEQDDPNLVWVKGSTAADGTASFTKGRFRASMHMVESKTATTVTFRPALPVDYTRSPQLSRYPDLLQNAGVENIKFVGTGTQPGIFINIVSAWNVWIYGCEFSNMPSKTIYAGWVGHLEIRRNYLHDQSNGGPNSEGIDLANDVNWSLVVDNICVAAGYPQINIGDMGQSSYYSGGVGNVIAYNYCVDSFYTDPPTSVNHGMMTSDIGTNHSPHTQYNLVEGNYISKFGSDSYHGSGSHTILLRNIITGRNRWVNATSRTAVQIDRRCLFYSLIGNVLGEVGHPTSYEYVATSGLPSWSIASSTIFRLGYPNVGNTGFTGTYPDTVASLYHGDSGPRDLYIDRMDRGNSGKFSTYGATIIEGNWTPQSGQDWTIAPQDIPNSYFLNSKPDWFGSLAWPPVNPENPKTDDPSVIPAGYRYLHEMADPPNTDDVQGSGDVSSDGKVTMHDAALVLRYTLGVNLSDAQRKEADINGDGKIDMSDAIAIARKALGL